MKQKIFIMILFMILSSLAYSLEKKAHPLLSFDFHQRYSAKSQVKANLMKKFHITEESLLSDHQSVYLNFHKKVCPYSTLDDFFSTFIAIVVIMYIIVPIIAGGLVVTGSILLGVGAWYYNTDQPDTGMPMMIAGGALLGTGVCVSIPFFITLGISLAEN